MTSPENAKSETRICLGKIAAPHGVKGLVKIFAYGDDPTLIQTLSPVFTSKDKNDTVTVTLKNAMGKFILAEIQGCDSREKSDEIKGTELWVERTTLPTLDNEDEFYIEDLSGLEAYDSETNEKIGAIIAVQNYGAGDLLELKPKSGASYFVPFQNEYVTDIDLENKKLTLKNPQHFKID